MCYEEIVSWARDGLAGVECLLSEIDDILQYLSTFDSGVRTSFPLAAFPAVVDRIAREYGVPMVTVLVQDDRTSQGSALITGS